MRSVGTTSRGIRMPIIRQGDDLVSIVAKGLKDAADNEGFQFHSKDVVGVTESVVARAYGNYCSVEDIAADVKAKLGGEEAVVLFPFCPATASPSAFGASPWVLRSCTLS